MIIISPCNERSFAQRNFKPLYLSEFNFGQRFHPPYMIMNYFVALFFFSPSFFFFHFKSWPTLAELKDNCSHLWKKFKVVFCGRAKSHSHVRLLFSWEEWGEGRSGGNSWPRSRYVNYIRNISLLLQLKFPPLH